MHPDDLARQDLARSIRFALKHKVVRGATKKAIRGLPEHDLAAMADDIAEHLVLCGWKHAPSQAGRHIDGTPKGAERSEMVTIAEIDLRRMPTPSKL
jgi:hypothetical protein